MKIPETVRIGSMNYKVEITDKTLIIKNKECYGRIDYDRHLIEINNQVQDEQGMSLTFMHELVHGIVSERNLNMGGEDNELKTEELARGLHQVIRDNPKVFIEGD